jgi:hypothetical protein
MPFYKFRVWINGKESEPFVMSHAQISAAGRIPGDLNDMIGVEKIIAEHMKQQKNVMDVSVEYFGVVENG